MDLKPIEMTAHAWKFLDNPDKYIDSWNSLKNRPYKLFPEAMERQMATAGEILNRFKYQFGVLLADDVGLGKTAIAALVGWVFAGKGHKVRIFAPNSHLRHKWRLEISYHIPVLNQVACHLAATDKQIKGPDLRQSPLPYVQITTYDKAMRSQTNPGCKLLIVDEAHHGKGNGELRKHLIELKEKNKCDRILLLTATPFSISPRELCSLLELSGMPEADAGKIKEFGMRMEEFWSQESTPMDGKEYGRQTLKLGKEAIEKLTPWIIRHGVEHLRSEKKWFGEIEPWTIPVPHADPATIEALLRADRLFRLARSIDVMEKCQSSDPRFHVGWSQLREDLDKLESKVGSKNADDGPQGRVIYKHISAIRNALSAIGEHPKVKAVAGQIVETVRQADEKVLVFCHHHATAAEFALAVHRRLRFEPSKAGINYEIWKMAWQMVLSGEQGSTDKLRAAFIHWLCSPGILHQVSTWMNRIPDDPNRLEQVLRKTPVRGKKGSPAIGKAASVLLAFLVNPQSPSTRGFLRKAAADPHTLHLPMGNVNPARVMALCRSPEGMDPGSEHVFLNPDKPETAMAVFNSPFGPDVLVTTDKLSEGVDLHRYCRHLVHFELSPSPMRTLQRNGRVRRIGSWSSTIRDEKPSGIKVAYPQFPGTRDQRLVEIMKSRLDNFDLLLGGVGGKIRIQDLDGSPVDSEARNIIEILRKGMPKNPLIVVRRFQRTA